MDPILRQYLVSLGLNPNATEAEAKSFYEGLSKDKKDAAPVKLGKPPVSVTVNLQQPAPEPKPAAEPSAAIVAPKPDPIEIEARRVENLNRIAKAVGLNAADVQSMIVAGVDGEAAVAEARKLLAKRNPPVANADTTQTIVGEDAQRKALATALPDAILLRAGRKVATPHELAGKFVGLSVLEMYRHYLSAIGVPDAFMLSKSKLVDSIGPRGFRRAFPQFLSQSTSDFDNILADTINKSLRQAYMDAPSTWNLWARRATAPDFKTVSRVAMSEVGALQAKAEGAEIKYITLSDSKETYALATYANGIKLTREAIINDDLDAFGRIPMLQASASRRKEDDVAYAILTANAALADGQLLFEESTYHKNYTSSGTAISVAAIGVGRQKMLGQLGPKSGGPLGITPRYLIVPTTKEFIATQLVQSAIDPSKSNNTPNPAPVRSLVVVADARLDVNSTTAWYLAADYNQCDTVEVCFLLDEPEPVTAQESDFDTLDMKFSVRHTVAAKALDYRGLYKNVGA